MNSRRFAAIVSLAKAAKLPRRLLDGCAGPILCSSAWRAAQPVPILKVSQYSHDLSAASRFLPYRISIVMIDRCGPTFVAQRIASSAPDLEPE